jgi:methionine-rich copper-binding protein CopC
MAHPKLVSAKPAEGAAASNVTQVSVTFSEPLMAAMSGMDLMMTGMPGMDHHQPMKMTGVKTSVAPDGVTLLAKLARPCPPAPMRPTGMSFPPTRIASRAS